VKEGIGIKEIFLRTTYYGTYSQYLLFEKSVIETSLHVNTFKKRKKKRTVRVLLFLFF
jgi:hypothetical protein